MTAKRVASRCLFLALPFFATSGCQPNVQASAPATTTASDLKSIKLQSVRFSQAYVENDLETQIGIYAQDAVIAPPGRGFVAGEGLREYWAQAPGNAVVSHRTIPDSIVVHGDLAYDWGRYEGAGGRVGSPSDFSGKYLIVWRRGADGMWRMVQDMWNAGAPQ